MRKTTLKEKTNQKEILNIQVNIQSSLSSATLPMTMTFLPIVVHYEVSRKSYKEWQTVVNNFLPLGMKDIIRKVFGEEVRFGRQHDAHEFLMILLHTFESSGCYQKAMKCIKQQ